MISALQRPVPPVRLHALPAMGNGCKTSSAPYIKIGCLMM